MTEDAASPDRHLDRVWLARHLADERRGANRLGEVREAIFGAQDGVTSILIVVVTVATATGERVAVLIAGIAAAIAEIISMAAGEYMSSRSQREVFEAQMAREALEVAERPDEAEAEVAQLLEEEGMSEAAAKRVAGELARSPAALLKTMIEKELGIIPAAGPGALQGALILAAAFAASSIVPIVPFLFLGVDAARWAAIGLSLVAVFGLGVAKSRITGRGWLRSGLEIAALVVAASAGGYLIGTLLPYALGFAPVA